MRRHREEYLVVVPVKVPGAEPDPRDLADTVEMIEEVRLPRDGDAVPFALALAALRLDRLIRYGFEKDPWLALAAIEAKARLLGLERRAAPAGRNHSPTD